MATMACITSELKVDGQILDEAQTAESPYKDVRVRVVEAMQERIGSVTCPEHAKGAERLVVEVDTKAGTVRATPEGFCCDQLRDLVLATL
jgi:hypothetical protein